MLICGSREIHKLINKREKSFMPVKDSMVYNGLDWAAPGKKTSKVHLPREDESIPSRIVKIAVH